MDFDLISPQAAIAYVQQNTAIFDKQARLTAHPLTMETIGVEGYVNIIHLIRDTESGQSVAFKQILPYVRAAQEDGVHIPLPTERLKVEVSAFKIWQTLCPDLIPHIYLIDEAHAIVIMEDLSRMNLLRFELTRQQQFPHLPAKLGGFLGKSAFYTSELYLNPVEKKRLAPALANPEFRVLFESFIFTDSFFGRKEINPAVAADLAALLADEAVLLEVLKLKDIYATQTQALIHSDLHTSNICVNHREMKIFDAESAFFGPVAFDVGRLLANFALNYASWEGIDGVSPEAKAEYRQYLLAAIVEIYRHFEQTFSRAWEQDAKPEYRQVAAGYKAAWFQTILRDMAGFAACACMARTYDEVICYDFARIENLAERAKAQKLTLRFIRALLRGRHHLTSIEDFVALLTETHAAYQIESSVSRVLARLTH
jgi:5-methylthioribose kinase